MYDLRHIPLHAICLEYLNYAFDNILKALELTELPYLTPEQLLEILNYIELYGSTSESS